MTQTVTACGRNIHIAANALRAVRAAALGAHGLAFPQWAAMETITENPGVTHEQLIRKLVERSVDDEDGIAQAIDQLQRSGLITTATGDSDPIQLTAQGKVLANRVIAARTGLREQLYGGIDADEMATTIRVLDAITQRARAIQRDT
jgi:DNA-binding MarR family transcriptional regulator